MIPLWCCIPRTIFFSFIQLDEGTQTLRQSIWITLRWQDHFLRWNQSDYDDYAELEIDQKKIWTPVSHKHFTLYIQCPNETSN